jgi:hypothetical protein
MRTKKLLFCILLGAIVVSISHSVAAYHEVAAMSNSQEIPLNGQFEAPGRLRSDIGIPITVEQQSDMLFVHFQKIIGVVQVTITDEYGDVVFTEMVNTITQPSLTISLIGLPSGNYEITFSNENGRMSGKFQT